MALLFFAAWSLLSGLSLLWPGDIFLTGPGYRLLRRLPVKEEWWGAIMILDAYVLARGAVEWSPSVLSVVTSLSAGLWCVFGLLVVTGGAEGGVFSVIGAWELVMAAGLIAATAQCVGWRGQHG